MTTKTEAGQPGPLAQLSEAAPAALQSVAAVPEPATPRYGAGLSLVRTAQSKYWERIECYQDTARPFAIESALNKSRHENSEVVAAFGSNLPPSGTFLLHYGPRWKTNKGKVIVLAHGASDNATRAWAAPEMMVGNPGTTGLMQALEAKDYRVFAVTFPHKHGNIFYEAQYLADAIDMARRATGAGKVTLIGHSAGGLAARAYVSSYRLNGSWTAYRGDVDQLITLATPHRGQDFAFRHPQFNYFFVKDDMAADAPMSWDKMLYYGQWKDTLEFSIYSDNFPMQQQVLYDWTGKYPVNLSEPDSYTTMQGGQGFVSHSMGISNAIMKGGNFINGFRAYPVPPDISVALIAGNNSKIDNIPVTENDGPSDGLVFLESASHTNDLIHPARKEPIKVMVVNENHLTIAYAPESVKLILSLIK
ncbi:MAG: alpha/beta fold hydrolase [Elusimicrobia bacterium]|nr:alpha/beta fold hydrolase [Elusimicrobiota bacterium]